MSPLKDFLVGAMLLVLYVLSAFGLALIIAGVGIHTQ